MSIDALKQVLNENKTKVGLLIEKAQSGGGEEFIGIKYSDFTGVYNLPKTADARSIPVPLEAEQGNNINYFARWFSNAALGNSGGYCASLEEVYLPDDIFAFGPSMFYSCGKLKILHGDFSKVVEIGSSAFEKCSVLEQIPHCPNLEKLNDHAFNTCPSLKTVTLPPTVTTISSSAFKSSSGITDIYCPWVEGAVANAPWGATNATIHYNTTFDENGNPIAAEV